VRIFKTKTFARITKKLLKDSALRDAVASAEKGLIDADLGGGVIKQRIAREGQGKSGGFRTIILFRFHERAFFVHAYPKSKLDNISDVDLALFKQAAAVMLEMPDDKLALAVASGEIIELIDLVNNADEDDDENDGTEEN
jgi:hypothetical protein